MIAQLLHVEGWMANDPIADTDTAIAIVNETAIFVQAMSETQQH